jgi:hypothetical protein
MKRISLSHGKGSFVIEAEALLIGTDIVVALWGGSVPHVGAVAMAIPRPSLQDKSVISATSSVLTSPGHKEDEIVKWFSELVSAALDGTVVVSAGIHWDNLTREDIGTIRLICEELCARLIAAARKEMT